MSESNKTRSQQTHRIFMSLPKSTNDRTRLYIIVLLCFLLFILIFYLVYNFISYKHYLSSRKKKKRKNNFYFYSENRPKINSILYEELPIPFQTDQLVSDL